MSRLPTITQRDVWLDACGGWRYDVERLWAKYAGGKHEVTALDALRAAMASQVDAGPADATDGFSIEAWALCWVACHALPASLEPAPPCFVGDDRSAARGRDWHEWLHLGSPGEPTRERAKRTRALIRRLERIERGEA